MTWKKWAVDVLNVDGCFDGLRLSNLSPVVFISSYRFVLCLELCNLGHFHSHFPHITKIQHFSFCNTLPEPVI